MRCLIRLREHERHRIRRVNSGSIKYRQRAHLNRNQQANFGTAEDNALRALLRQPLNDAEVVIA